MTRSYESCHNLQDLMTEKVLPSSRASPVLSDTDSESSPMVTTPLHLQQEQQIRQFPRTESKASLRWKRERQQDAYRYFMECQPRLRIVWACHFVASILALSCGMLSPETSQQKYTPIKESDLLEDRSGDCFKGFINVFSESREETNALLLCCQDDSTINSAICPAQSPILFFGGRLSRFPEAWLLPLVPLLIRGFVEWTVGNMKKQSRTLWSNLYVKRRFFLYLGLILLRGWILYFLFDTIEDNLVSQPQGDCWFDEFVSKGNAQQHCQGRAMDFSDHVVLYFAQILPIALVEVLHAFVSPYWKTQGPISWRRMVVPFVLAGWMVNLYGVTLLGAYTTSVYFHTAKEVWVGYLVSLLVQIPLCLIQCTAYLPQPLEYFFGQALS